MSYQIPITAQLLATLPAERDLHCNPTALYQGAYVVDVSTPSKPTRLVGQPHKRDSTGHATLASDWLRTLASTPDYPALRAYAAELMKTILGPKAGRHTEPASFRHLFGSLTTLKILSMLPPLQPTEHTVLHANNLAIGLIFATIDGSCLGRLRLLDCSAIRLPEPINMASADGVKSTFIWPSWLWLSAPTLKMAKSLSSTIPGARVLISPELLLSEQPHKTTPWLTIVIACIDAAELGNTLSSIWQQSDPEGTHVVVVNATKQPLELSDMLSPGRHIQSFEVVDVIDNGPYEAMNLGLLLSESEWIYFLGVNDSFADPLVLEDLRTKINSLPDDCNFVYGNVRMIGAGPGSQNGEIYAGHFNYTRLKKQNICHQAIFYRREALLNIGGFDLKYHVNSDWAVNLRIWHSARPQYFGRTIANFSRGGLSSTVIDKAFFDDLEGLWETNALY